MNAAAAARLTLTALLGEGTIERVPVDEVVVANLQRQATNHLRTAEAGIAVDDPEGAFQVAYDACRKISLALVLAAGFRVKEEKKGHHRATFEAAQALATTFNERNLAEEASDLRFVRNSTEYRAETVDERDATDAISIGRDLTEVYAGPIRRLLEEAGVVLDGGASHGDTGSDVDLGGS